MEKYPANSFSELKIKYVEEIEIFSKKIALFIKKFSMSLSLLLNPFNLLRTLSSPFVIITLLKKM